MRLRRGSTGAGPPDVEDRAAARTRCRFARRQWARRWLSWRRAVAVLIPVALVATAAWFVLFSTRMQVHEVEVAGNDLLSDADIRRVAQVPIGEQLALVDLDRAGQRVAALAEVEGVDVVRNWPDTVEIKVVERTAVAVVEFSGRLRGLDATGVIFRDFKRVPAGMPRVRASDTSDADALRGAAGVVAALPADLAARVDHVEVETMDQILLVFRNGRRVLWGSAEDSTRKAEVLALLLEQPGQVFDVSVPGSPTVR